MVYSGGEARKGGFIGPTGDMGGGLQLVFCFHFPVSLFPLFLSVRGQMTKE